ncbi:bifunctional adenosylcobinamide kinase/adenosylcobinamide-phosphate guanylyltransferase [Segeticoccus rhizosphaerae]|uniref:bifunctional adenosylcobinamide kinase/adenosylcobinamide-phosphate guanylyltransferase n=1 Tax=Segeticoccus rhizosphaerae TaxID=1104777 RepID=UPI001264B2DF|nr:bifunctional adenosylcobinamide kinase/adenosylcobinamide-phosphate guanylyltransferase [Segeticoccus rhizosphaerae]
MTTTLVLGGARSGKSRHAESLLTGQSGVHYLAPGPLPNREVDPEWADRVAAHRDRRPAGWRTVETTNLSGAIIAARGPVLVDCLSTWVASLIDDIGAWDDPAATKHLESRTAEFLVAWTSVPYDLVAVSNEVGMAVVPATASGRLFRDGLGRVNAAVSAASDQVHLVIAGRVMDLSSLPVVADVSGFADA